jgi:large subunit ribosomal protein L25
VLNELNIQCLASQLPEFISVDLGALAKGQTLNVSDIKLGEGMKVVTHGKPNPVVASASVQAAEEEAPAAAVAPVVVTPAAPATKEKKKKDEKQNKK